MTTAPSSLAFHLLAAIVTAGAFLLLVQLLPSLATAGELKLVVGLLGAAAAMRHNS